MAIYSLTTERVNTLLKQRGAKEVELNELLNLSAKDLWNRDLDELSVAFQDMLNQDILNAQQDQKGKKKTTSKFAKVNRKRVSDAADGGEYMEKKPKAAKLKANTSPNSKPSKTTSFATKPSGAKEMHTAAFTSVNKTGSSSLAIPTKETLTKATSIITIDDDDEFDALIKDVRPSKPSTVVKPKKTFSIPGIKKPSTSAPKPRAVSKPKAPKRKVESEDEDDSFAFMDEGPSAPVVEARRPARAAASKARAIVLTSDDVFDELDDEEELDSEEEEDE
jgi:DNA topoisomerase-2